MAMKGTTTQQSFDFDTLYEALVMPVFERIHRADERRSNSSYTLKDACKSAFAIYSLKAPSLFAFRARTQAELSNLQTVFGIDKLPSDNGLRKMLDGVASQQLREAFHKVFAYLKKQEVLDAYRYFDNHLVVSIDGVEHYCSQKISCPHCMVRQHRDGSTSYYHSMLSAALVCPGRAEVFVLDNEPMVRQDGAVKNDCERNAATRMFAQLRDKYASESVVYVMDALYGCAPIIELVSQASASWKYLINCKEKGHKYLFAQFDERNEEGHIKWKTVRRKDGSYEIGYTSGLMLNASNQGVTTNMVLVNFRSKKGEVKTFSWITNIEPTALNVMQLVEMGRSRWKIENEVFNTLKNQEYNFEHSFGHGQQNLATNFAYIMMLAFTIDQLQQYGSRIFRSIWKGLKTRVAVWDAIRNIFKMVKCQSMSELHRNLLKTYQLQLIRV